MSQNSKKIHQNQKMMFAGLFSAVVALVGLVFYFMTPSENRQVLVTAKKVDLPIDDVSPQEMWNIRQEGKMDIVQQKMDYFEKLIIESKKKEEMKERENADLKEEIAKLKVDLRIAKEKPVEPKQQELAFTKPNQQDLAQHSTYYTEQQPKSYQPRNPLVIQTVSTNTDKIKHVDRVIPAGTTVKALLVSSVDAPCGAYTSNDPQPVKLQILDDGHLPKKVRAKLKGGIVLASVYGDLSSERINIRLERLTQVKPSGEFIETEVTGFVTGEDGKYGVRGAVVDKSAAMVKNAALSGFFSGINNYFQAYASSRCGKWGGCAPYYGSNCSPCDPNEFSTADHTYNLVTQGGTSGIGNAFDTLTDYYIRRAELIKPVIQVNAGRIVDITFTYGTEVGDLHTKDKVRSLRQKCRGDLCVK